MSGPRLTAEPSRDGFLLTQRDVFESDAEEAVRIGIGGDDCTVGIPLHGVGTHAETVKPAQRREILVGETTKVVELPFCSVH